MIRYRTLQYRRADGQVLPYGLAYQEGVPGSAGSQVLLFVPHWRTQRRLEVDDLSHLSAAHYPPAPCPLEWSSIEEWPADSNAPEGFRPIVVMQHATRSSHRTREAGLGQ